MSIDLIIEIVIVIILFIIITLLVKLVISKKKVKRVSFYAMEPIHDNSVPLTDRLIKVYFSLLSKCRKYIKRVDYFNRKARKYDKYIKYKHRDNITSIDFITNKLVIMVLFLILAIISSIFTTGINLFALVIDAIIGNNAFKSGKSTLQALKIASLELPEPISDEFKKMYLDMKYGLSVDTVFDRFAKRVNLEEATFLSSSLTILNKTGGNIVLVFSSIERTLFDKKKLNEELKNISAGPNMIIKVLFIIPIIFTLIIYILNPEYFNPLFESTLGYMIVGIIVVMFIIYVLLLKRITKIDL